MIAKDLFKIESSAEISNDRLKTLILLYLPLIGVDALALYEFLVIKGSNNSFDEFTKILNTLNYSIDRFDNALINLNKYKLVKTLKSKESNYYILQVSSPLLFREFVNDEIFIRDFILKTSSGYYQSLIVNNLNNFDKHNSFDDISVKLDSNILNNWNKQYEINLNKTETTKPKFDTLFDINKLLNNVTTNLFPIKYRTFENLYAIAKLADVFSISYDMMRSFLTKVIDYETEKFDLEKLKALCKNANLQYMSLTEGQYKAPCSLFLMNLQNGKSVTPYDNETLLILSDKYNLRAEVINALVEFVLKNSDNRLIRNYIEPLASDLHRNDIKIAKDAIERLNKQYTSSKQKVQQIIPTYKDADIPTFDKDELDRLIKNRGKHE